MKKIILAAMISLFWVSAFSQEEASTKLGVRLGYQMQSFNEDEVDPGFLGFGGGVKVDIPIVNNLYFSSGLNFMHRQLFTITATGYNSEGRKVKQTLDMTEFAISVPLMFQIKANDIFYLATGLQLDIPFLSEMNFESSGGGESEPESYFFM